MKLTYFQNYLLVFLLHHRPSYLLGPHLHPHLPTCQKRLELLGQNLHHLSMLFVIY